MTDLDPRIGELLDARTPPRAVTPDWNAVLTQAGMASRARRRRRRPSPGWLLLAAAIAIPAGLAVAQVGHGIVHYLSGPATPRQRAVVRPLVHPFTGAPGVHGDVKHGRQLVSVSAGGHRYLFVMVPLTGHAAGGCFFEIVDGKRVEDNDCGFDPQDRHPRTSPPKVVGAGTALGAEPFEIEHLPLWVVLGDMPDGIRSVVVHFQDGSTVPAPTNGRFFSYVVRGAHVTAGHRPTALVGRTASGKTQAVQLVDPQAFDLGAIRRLDDRMVRELNIPYLAHNASNGVSHGQMTQFDQVATTPERIARVFGGRPQAYPKHPVVIVLRGPFAVTVQKRGCKAVAEVCPVPRGRWAYLAYVINPDVSLAGHVPPGAITWLRKAPAGTTFPDLHRLGNVIHVRFR
jgi:hypothetical protein